MRRVLRWIWPGGRWRWLWRGAIGMIVFSVVSVEMTSQSWFCNSCHIMNSYYTSWQASTHKDVKCVQCHIAPGTTNFISAKLNGAGQVVDDLLHRTSTKPSAQVADASCTRSGCHAIEKVRATTVNKGKYLFDHGKHLSTEHLGIEIRCTTCHSHVKGKNHFEVNTTACVTCHLIYKKDAGTTPSTRPAQESPVVLVSMNSGESHGAVPAKKASAECKSCHEPPKNTIEYRGLKIVHSEYLAYGASCESCHIGVTDPAQKIKDDACFSCHEFGLEKLTNVAETHRIHSTGRHKVECFSCHGVTKHGPSVQSMHMDRIDCQSCHQGQHAIQQTTYKHLEETPASTQPAAISPMFMVHVHCTGCHTEPRSLTSKPTSGATVAAATAKACDTCHQAGLGEKMIPLWQKNTRALYDGTQKSVAAAKPASAKAQRLVGEARGLLDLVRLDGSWGAHNPRYTQKLLEDAQRKLLEAKE